MPTYEYYCKECGHEMEAFQRMSDAALSDCPSCEEPSLQRKIGRGAGFIFKGSGFYETDFKDRKGTKPSEGASESKDSGSSGSAAAPATKESSTSSPAKSEAPASKAAD